VRQGDGGMESLDWAGLQARWVDVAMLAWLAISVLTGLLRGVVFEVLSVLGWGVAYFAAHWAAPQLAPYLPVEAADPTLRHAAAFACAFLAVAILWSVAARLVRMLIRATPLSLPDRMLGGGFGLLRGLLVLLVVATLMAFTPMVDSKAWKMSQGGVWLNVALHGLKPVLPSEISQHLPA